MINILENNWILTLSHFGVGGTDETCLIMRNTPNVGWVTREPGTFVAFIAPVISKDK